MGISDKIHSIRPSPLLKSFLDYSFVAIYILLIAEFIILLDGDTFDFEKLIVPQPFFIIMINRFSSILYQPFGFAHISTIVFALFGYAVFHFGMFLDVPADKKDLFMNKILDFCRVVFFLAGTLLILLIIARMFVMLYQDVTVGRPVINIGKPEK